MATRTQNQRYKVKRIFAATTGSTATRDTKCNDLQYNNYAFHISNATLALRWMTCRKDAIL